MIPAIILTLSVILFRVVMGFNDIATNFSPVAAIVLCSAVFLPLRIALPLAFGSLFVSDLLLNAHYGVGLSLAFFVKYAAFALIFGLGYWLRQNPKFSLKGIFGTTIAAALLFYVITNTMSWATDPAYAKSLGGWFQALTIGNPAFATPTWMFFRNSLAGNLFFTGLFVLLVKPDLFRIRSRSAGTIPAAQ